MLLPFTTTTKKVKEESCSRFRPLPNVHNDTDTDNARTNKVAAPLATCRLADAGARVIKIERDGTGDFARHYDSYVEGQSTYFAWL